VNALGPQSFPELLAGVIAVTALLLTIISLLSRLRGHATRMLAILFATSIALFSDHWTTYFAALFIVATAVTELEFLQNLAAIIRGNKPYFDYKKVLLTPDETDEETSTIGDDRRREGTPDERRSRSRLNRAMFRAVVEQLAAKKLSQIFGAPVELHVRFVRNGLRVDVEGVIQGNEDARDRLFRFEFIRKQVETQRLIDAVHHLDELAPRYATITRSSCEGHVVAVILDDTECSEETQLEVQAAIDRSQFVVSLRVLTRKMIGLDLIDESVWQTVG
jgi:hypothetical protein